MIGIFIRHVQLPTVRPYEKLLYESQISNAHQFDSCASIRNSRTGKQAKLPRRIPHSAIWHVVAPACGLHACPDANRAECTGGKQKHGEFYQPLAQGHFFDPHRMAMDWFNF